MVRQKLDPKNSTGYVALITVLVLGAVGAAVAATLVLLGLSSSRTSFALEQSNQAKALANACAEEALQQIRDSSSFTGSAVVTRFGDRRGGGEEGEGFDHSDKPDHGGGFLAGGCGLLEKIGIFNTVKKSGFTLLEILLVVAALAILAGIVILAINPTKQLADTRNAQRAVDINTILNAVYQYSIDNNGTLPSAIPASATCATPSTNEICKTGGTCTGLVSLAVLTASEKYIVSVPFDPTGATANGTGYFVAKNANGRVTVCAPSAEQGKSITVTR
jgi:prepilin-type N-terminal cleavage/methylation domain-containing protein